MYITDYVKVTVERENERYWWNVHIREAELVRQVLEQRFGTEHVRVEPRRTDPAWPMGRLSTLENIRREMGL